MTISLIPVPPVIPGMYLCQREKNGVKTSEIVEICAKGNGHLEVRSPYVTTALERMSKAWWSEPLEVKRCES
jgi:hypothetical protein